MTKAEQRKMMRLALRVQMLELVDLRTRLAEYEDMARAIVERADEQNPVDGFPAVTLGGGVFE